MTWNWKSEIPLLLAIAAAFVLSAVVWNRVPDEIPIHFDVTGTPDSYGSRAVGLLMLPGIGVLLYLLFFLLPAIDPGRSNYSSFAGAYTLIRFATIGMMLAVHVVIVAIALGVELSVNLIVPPLVGVLFLVIGNVLGKVRPNWFVGVKTPWTLSSKRSWDRTHRLAGRGMIALGIAIMFLGLIQERWAAFALVGAILVYVIGLFAYSWWVWRGDPDRNAPAATEPADE